MVVVRPVALALMIMVVAVHLRLSAARRQKGLDSESLHDAVVRHDRPLARNVSCASIRAHVIGCRIIVLFRVALAPSKRAQ